MKKTIFFSLVSLISIAGFSQSERYAKSMEPKVAAIETTREPAALLELSASFERIAQAEKTQWLPYYYAALAQVNAGTFTATGKAGVASITDPIADKAEALLTQAEVLTKPNSEIYIVKKMIATLRLMADPQNRYKTYGPQAQQALGMAFKLNPDNPRAYLLDGQDKYYTPAQYGGSKIGAFRAFQSAKAKFESFQPQTPLDPYWGKATNDYFLTLDFK